jgi:dipeptidyl aminopeptidase/acylaminoacyl peptidase
VLIDNYSDIENHAYILYNTDTKQQILLGETTPDIAADRMARISMVRYKARDGLSIPAYLTLPNGATRKKLPTVVLLGAQAHRRNGSWQWNAEVLQPEPRGVSGFGHAHYEAGINQSGRAVQDDIADAVKWAVAQGHTDPARVCVAGIGYGGYASMMALLRDADVFKCGINWSGLTTCQDNPDDARLKEIKRPLLLAYGTDDEGDKYKQALALYKSIKAANPQAEWLEYTSTVEDWKTQKNRIDLWQRIEDFLARQIGAQ